jgi:hypothetical protein
MSTAIHTTTAGPRACSSPPLAFPLFNPEKLPPGEIFLTFISYKLVYMRTGSVRIIRFIQLIDFMARLGHEEPNLTNKADKCIIINRYDSMRDLFPFGQAGANSSFLRIAGQFGQMTDILGVMQTDLPPK